MENKQRPTGFSFIVPCEDGRLSLFKKSLAHYLILNNNFKDMEMLVVSRSMTKETFNTLGKHIETFNIRLIKYEYMFPNFNVCVALNRGVRDSKYNNIVVTCPEVLPKTPILDQVRSLERGNYICKAYDQEKDGKLILLVDSKYRSYCPYLYFLGIFKIEDIVTINGWDENFVHGYSFEDEDFGNRLVRSGAKFKILDDFVVVHQYHQRGVGLGHLWDLNKNLFFNNNSRSLIRAERGLV